jgi:hypothetical protein
MNKSNYEKRREFCYHKAKSDRENSYYWIQAAEVYEHLIECNLTHSGANPTCRWNANGVEK